jgi:co-chaperonin GroES (HSP10)
MTIKISGHRLLIEPVDIAKKTETDWGFQVVVPENEREYVANTSEGTVLVVGKTCWMAYDYYKPNGERNPAWEPWCKVGDVIHFAKYGGKWIEHEGKKYIVINDQDVIGVVENG